MSWCQLNVWGLLAHTEHTVSTKPGPEAVLDRSVPKARYSPFTLHLLSNAYSRPAPAIQVTPRWLPPAAATDRMRPVHVRQAPITLSVTSTMAAPAFP